MWAFVFGYPDLIQNFGSVGFANTGVREAMNIEFRKAWLAINKKGQLDQKVTAFYMLCKSRVAFV